MCVPYEPRRAVFSSHLEIQRLCDVSTFMTASSKIRKPGDLQRQKARLVELEGSVLGTILK